VTESVANFALPKALRLVLAYSWNPIGYQILNPGILHWFSERDDAVVGYVVCRGIRVVAGAPICPPSLLQETTEKFERDTKRHGERVCYFHAGPRFASVLGGSRKHSIARIGSLPYWNPSDWQTVLSSDASLRYQVRRAYNKGLRVTEVPAEAARQSDELREIRQQWLRRKHLPPLHFLIEPEIFDQLADRRLFVAKENSRALGYLMCSPMPNRNGWLLEQWASADAAPLGTSELLIHEVMTTFGAERYQEVTMGLVPLSSEGLVPGSPGPLWLNLLFRFVKMTANPLYNFKGLEHFKYKFHPHYSEPVYAVVNKARFSPIDVLAIIHAFAGSPLQLFAWHTVKKIAGKLSARDSA